MNWVLGISLTSILSAAHALPMGCKEDDHCPTGYYCALGPLYCHKCLRCEDLKRAPPEIVKGAATCVTSVTECGSCFAGLVADTKSNECMPPGASGHLLLPYEWAVIGVALFLASLVCAAAVYILRNFNILKIRASTSASVESPVANSLLPPTAPQPPPPYNAIMPPMENSEESRPFIKPSARPGGAGGGGGEGGAGRAVAASQTARVFSNPAYVRASQPLSYETPAYNEMLSTIREDVNSSNEQSIANSMMSEAERDDNVVQASSAKILNTRQDSNNNSGEAGSDGGAPVFASHSGTAIVINVVKNVNTLQQKMY